MKNANQTGFTLIELVFVVAVIGIIMAAALPRFMDLTSESRSMTITKSAHSIEAAIVIAEDMHNQKVSYDLLPDLVKTGLSYTTTGNAGNNQQGVFHFEQDAPDSGCRIVVDLSAKPSYENLQDARVLAETECV